MGGGVALPEPNADDVVICLIQFFYKKRRGRRSLSRAVLGGPLRAALVPKPPLSSHGDQGPGREGAVHRDAPKARERRQRAERGANTEIRVRASYALARGARF